MANANRDQMLSEMRRLTERDGKLPQQHEFEAEVGITESEWRSHFTTWEAVVDAAGGTDAESELEQREPGEQEERLESAIPTIAEPESAIPTLDSLGPAYDENLHARHVGILLNALNDTSSSP